uniref:Uncharacterized protein n=1 Tax=Meloidogyne incognita TaxID=6306 RepID=A0A914NWF5_MELIC
VSRLFLAKFYAVAVSRLFLAKFYAVAVSRLFLAKFYAVAVSRLFLAKFYAVAVSRLFLAKFYAVAVLIHFLAKFYAVAVSRLFLAKFYAVAVSRLFLAKFYAVAVSRLFLAKFYAVAVSRLFLAKFYAVAVSRLFLAKFYAVAVSRLFLAKFYAVEVEHHLNNISYSATLTNFFNSTASTQPTSTQQHQLNQPTQQHQLNQLQLNSINSTNFNSTASTQPTSTQQHQLNQLLQLSNIFIQQQLQLNNKNYRAILKTMQTLELNRKWFRHFGDVLLPLNWFGTCVVLVYIIFQKVENEFRYELLRVVLGLDYFFGFPFSGVEGSVPSLSRFDTLFKHFWAYFFYKDVNSTTSQLGLYSKLMAILEIWAGKLRLTPFAEFCSADFSYSHGFSIQPIPEMDEFIVYTNKSFNVSLYELKKYISESKAELKDSEKQFAFTKLRFLYSIKNQNERFYQIIARLISSIICKV